MTPAGLPGSIARSIVDRIEESSRELQRQAPAARMVGEFAVKMLLKQARRLASSAGSPGVEHRRRASDSLSESAAPWPPPNPPET